MNSIEIYKLLDNGWIYVIFNDIDNLYFNKTIIEQLPKKDVKRIDNNIFIKKSKRLYSILQVLSMNMDLYDSCVVIIIKKENDRIKINIYSTSNQQTLMNISEKIVNKSFIK